MQRHADKYLWIVRLCAVFLLAIVPCCGGSEQAPPQGTVESERGLVIAQYSPPTPPEFEAGPTRLPHLTRALRSRWPHILSAAVSHDGKHVVFYSGSGVYLTNAQGKKACKLRVLLPKEIANQETLVSFAFRRDNRRIAIMTTLIGGEPIGYTIERLWTAGVASGRVRQLMKWEYRVQGSSPVTADRQIEGWTKNGRAVIITGTVYGGKEMPVDARKIGTKRMVVKDIVK